MKCFTVLIICLTLSSCSFDNKTGIWKNEKNDSDDQSNIFKDFKTVTTFENKFNKVIPFDNKNKFQLLKPINNLEWNDEFFGLNNNLKNFQYDDLNKIILKSKKLSNNKVFERKLFANNHLIISDEKGNIIIYSISKKKTIFRFNFYKKKYKKIKKKLNLIIENDILYVSDNVGYLYAFNYKYNKLVWAKNYKIPFRSNLKIFNNKIIVSNQNNNLFFLNKINGDLIKFIPTEETIVKNKFINNLSIDDKNNLFFLNTYGSLYSIDAKNMKINWFLNLNKSTDINPSNLFNSVQIVSNENKVLIGSNNKTFIIDKNSGFIVNKFTFAPLIKPIINKTNAFLITENNYLISIDLSTNKILYSSYINQEIANFLNVNKKNVEIQSFMLLSNKITIFLKNSFVLNFNSNGKLQSVKKLPSKLNSIPIIINKLLYFLDKKNRLVILS